MMSKIVFLTGAGMSAESGISTFRDAGGLWEQYPVMQVASHTGWLQDPDLVTRFYNERRKQLFDTQPCGGHRLVAELEQRSEVVVITQNVDDLHERAGSTKVIHLHGELRKVCSSRDVEDPACWQVLERDNCEVPVGTKAADGSLLRPYIVFFEEAVPMIEPAAQQVSEADVLVIIGTSLNVYPAAGLVNYVRQGVPVYLIDPKEVSTPVGIDVVHIKAGATEGMEQLLERLDI